MRLLARNLRFARAKASHLRLVLLVLLLLLAGCESQSPTVVTQADDTPTPETSPTPHVSPTPQASPTPIASPTPQASPTPIASPTPQASPTSIAPNVVSIEELFKLREENEPAFVTLYLDQFVQVSGLVTSIGGDRVVEIMDLTGENKLRCRVPQASIQSLLPVRPGMIVTVLGRVTVERRLLISTTIALQDCYISDHVDPPTTTPTSTPTDTPVPLTPTPSATVAPTNTPVPLTPTPSATVAPTNTSAGPSPSTVTATTTVDRTIYYVANTDGDGVNIRRTPDLGDRIKAWPDGTQMVRVGPSVTVESRIWENVRDPDGTVGFIPAQYLITEQQAAATRAAQPPTATQTPARQALALSLPRQAEVPGDIPAYDRDSWRQWVDEDGDCQDARQEALIAESRSPVTFKSSRNCKVASGTWVGPYTGVEFTDPSDLDIDHMVPLANAHRSGAWAWDAAEKRAYANDLSYAGHLIATSASANRSKGSRGPADWKPSLQSYWCTYAVDWITIKVRWDLTATARELAALRHMLGTCAPNGTVLESGPGDDQPTDAPTSQPASAQPTATRAPARPTAAPAGTALELYDDNGNGRITCAEARSHGIAPVRRGHPAYQYMNDRDDDGIVCE